jgi:hypothetical protein
MASPRLWGLEPMGESLGNAMTNAPKGTHHRANRDRNLLSCRREIVEVIYPLAPELHTWEFVIMLEEASGASVQTMLFNAGHECFEGN